MSKMRMGHAAGVSLALLLGAAAIAEAQVGKPRPAAPPVIRSQPAAGQQPTGPQVAAGTIQVANLLLPCCIVQGIEAAEDPKGVGGTPSLRAQSVLLIKHTQTGQVDRMRVSGAASAKYRPGQAVDMNVAKTAIAVTPFPVEEYKRKEINGNSSWVMKTWVTVSNDGSLNGKTNIKTSEAARGFTGGVEVLLTDKAGNILHQTDLRTYGVNGTAMGGKSERTENWSEPVPADALNKVRAVVIHHSYEPKVRLAAGLGWIKDNWKVVVKVYKCGSALLAEDEDGAVASAPPPPPPAAGQPTSQGQPPASDTSMTECVEATQELAESLGY